MNYHELQADLLDRIGTVKADAELTMLTLALIQDIDDAARHGALAPQYRPATRDAVNHARAAYRHVCALVSREDFRRLMANAKPEPRTYHTEPSKNFYGGFYTGD